MDNQQPSLGKDEILGYIEKLKQIEKDLSSNEVEDMSFLDDLNTLMGKLTKEFNEQSFMSSSDLIVRVKRLHKDAVIPTYAKLGDAGMDLTITEIKSYNEKQITYGFGIAMEIPVGYVGLIFPRSSVRNYELILSNCVGVIDSGYRGEIMSTFNKTNEMVNGRRYNAAQYNIGDKGAQIIIIPIPKVKLVESDTLDDTERSTGGFGHSGK